MNFRIISSSAIAAVTILLIGSCSADPDSAGFEYMPDMYRSAAIEPYVDYGELRGRENKEVKLIQSAMTPPSNTIPYYGTDQEEVNLMLPYKRKATKAFETTHGMFGAEFSDEDDYALAVADVKVVRHYLIQNVRIAMEQKVTVMDRWLKVEFMRVFPIMLT